MPFVSPVSVRLAWWGTAWLRGRVTPDDLIEALLRDDAIHLVGAPGADSEPLMTGLGSLRSGGADAIGAALPVEGDLSGLGGPPAFNAAALELGEAAVVLDAAGHPLCGLLPHRVGSAVTWIKHQADRRQVPDLEDADRQLRRLMSTTADDLARLDVASWRPEVVDELLNLHHRQIEIVPPGIPERCGDLAARAQQALRIIELAREDDGRALSAHEADARRGALNPLARAARAALVSAASPEGWPPQA